MKSGCSLSILHDNAAHFVPSQASVAGKGSGASDTPPPAANANFASQGALSEGNRHLRRPHRATRPSLIAPIGGRLWHQVSV